MSKPSLGFTKDELEIIKRAFDLFDPDHTGRSDIKEIIETLKNVEYDQKNPVLFDIIAAMDTPDAQKKGGVSFFEFMDEINGKLGDKGTSQGLRRMYDVFVDDSNTIKKASLKEICKEIGQDYDDERLNEALDKLAQYGTNITFEEFEDIILPKEEKKGK